MDKNITNEVTVTDADIQALAAEATAAGDNRQIALCCAVLCQTAKPELHAARMLENLGYQRREHQLLGAGRARTGWWQIGAGGRVTRFMGRTAREAARKICTGVILDARRNAED